MAEQIDSKIPKIRFKGFEGNWDEKILGCVASVTTGKLDANAMTANGIYDFYTSGIKKYKIDVAAFTGPAITIAGNGATVGYMHLADGKFNAYQRTYVLNNFTADRSFIFYGTGIRLPKKISEEARTGNIPYIVMDMLTELGLNIPNPGEQALIGKYFRELDGLIGLHQRKHDKLVTLKKAMLQKMFPQLGAPTPEIRFKGFSGDWVVKTLAEISEIKTGPFGSTLHAKDYVPDGTPIITTEHFKSWRLPEAKKGLPQVSTNDYRRLKNYVLKQGDIVFSRVGSIDINAHVEEKQNGWLFSGRVLRVRTLLSIDSEYLHHELSTDRVRKCVTERAVGQTMPSINTGILGATVVFLPERKAEQQKIGTYFRTLDELISKHAIQLQKLQQLKFACLEKMFV